MSCFLVAQQKIGESVGLGALQDEEILEANSKVL